MLYEVITGRIRVDLHGLCVLAFALEETRRVAFRRIRHQAFEDLQELVDTRACLRRYEADRYEA